jgi:hypothetical protein
MNQLTKELYNNLGIKLSRSRNISQIILGIIISSNVNLKSIAQTFGGKALIASSIRKIQRVLEIPIDISMFIGLILKWFRIKKVVISIDRTNWKLGKHNANILMVGIVSKYMVIPLAWHIMQKGGNSNEIERILLMQNIIGRVGKILAIVGDREFIGTKWLEWLQQHKIPFCIRIRKNQYVKYKEKLIKASKLFNSSKFSNKGKVYLDDIEVNLSGCSLEKEQLILVSYNVDNPSKMYRKRWGIETLFQNLKGRGFNLENTHITDRVRFNSLLVCISIAAILCYKSGTLKAKIKHIKIKNHGRKACSFFRYGLDEIRTTLYSAFNFINYPLKILMQNILKLPIYLALP